MFGTGSLREIACIRATQAKNIRIESIKNNKLNTLNYINTDILRYEFMSYKVIN